uniref:Retrotransposon gag domain-containing protein n=1 Tax=Trichuris muris TaxID=70415 RepID=A0A5S6QN35_TRIMR
MVSPALPCEKAYEELVDLLNAHFCPKPSEIVRRFLFHKREQQVSENVSAYFAELRRLAEHCHFGASLESMLRDRILCGVRDKHLQRHLLAETSLTFKMAQEMAIASESAQIGLKELRRAEYPPNVELVSKSLAKYGLPSRNTEAQRDKAKPCYRCNGRHAQQNCQFRNVDCRFYEKKGHIERACCAKAQQKSYSEPRQRNAAGNRQSGSSALKRQPGWKEQLLNRRHLSYSAGKNAVSFTISED